MARPLASDFLHSMRFQVKLSCENAALVNSFTGSPEAGFNNVSTPEATVEAVEYKEGTDIYTRKYPGNPSMSDCTLSRGVAVQRAGFWQWVRQIMEGVGDYRGELQINHYHRTGFMTRSFPGNYPGEMASANPDRLGTPDRRYTLFEAFPIRCKIAGDLDATSSEISLEEIDVSYEYFDLEEAA